MPRFLNTAPSSARTYARATRATARLLVGTVLMLAMLSTLAQLAGCHVTRAIPTAQAAPTTLQPIDCGTWVDYA